MKFGLNEKTIEQIHSAFARYPQVKKAVIYGSRAKGNNSKGSDIDLTLMGGSDLTVRVLYRIMDDLEALPVPYSFDISIYHQIDDPDVISHIERVGLPFYEKT
ncbi:MAG: nucleotidyltransferase domain-containing protein [Thermodesulfobacteriota bacterium]|nr:nucleotidyltransferase domain-containing protein [Thermodesulfobacteriota bacterium]